MILETSPFSTNLILSQIKTKYYRKSEQIKWNWNWQYGLLVIHSWLLLPGILDISNFAISRAIYPAPLSFSTWSKQKTIGKTIIYSCYLEIFSFKNFSQISLFKHPVAQLLHLCRQEWYSQIEFFFVLFSDRMCWLEFFYR